MLLGKVSGKVTTGKFAFRAEAKVRKLDYVMAKDPEGKWVLAFVDSITAYKDYSIAEARVVGYRDARGFLKTPRIPFASDTPVYSAEKAFIQETMGLRENGLYIGVLEGYKIKVMLAPEHLIRKHVSILAKTGTGKSYLAGVLLEELAEARIPVLVFDPHGEYHTLAYRNSKREELKFSEMFDIEPKSYKDQVQVFGVRHGKPLRLSSALQAEDILQMLPAKVSQGNKALLYTAVRNMEKEDYTLKDIIDEIEKGKSQSKWGLISLLQNLLDTKLFSANPTRPEELVQPGKISIIDMKEDRPDMQGIIVFKVLNELFEARKRGKIPPCMVVIEEAQNFAPERGYGEVPSSKTIRTIASEGRKFGVGLCVISQRPARVEKNVLSQCNTQMILKVTNPNDLAAISDSVEGAMPGLKDEIRDLPIGAAVIVGATENPLVVDVRIRRSEHGGGESVRVEREVVEEQLVFMPRVSEGDIKSEFKGLEEVSLVNYPAWRIECKDKSNLIDLYIDGITGEIMFEQYGSLQRSRGIKSLLSVSGVDRKILLYLLSNKSSNVWKLSDEIGVPLKEIEGHVKGLAAKGMISKDEYICTSRLDLNMPMDVSLLKISDTVSMGKVQGTALDFQVKADFARAVSEIWGLHVIRIEPVYYPYWLVKHMATKVLIDGLTSRLDLDTTKVVGRLV
ncbi:MAG: ATP-binding protein [Candidatus Aenigmarchaeota archaeon]|nr:ATP-binding protein [Candidatus Aenigmarchaeota archaeon]